MEEGHLLPGLWERGLDSPVCLPPRVTFCGPACLTLPALDTRTLHFHRDLQPRVLGQVSGVRFAVDYFSQSEQ